LLFTLTVALLVPTKAGLKLTVKLCEAPAAIVKGYTGAFIIEKSPALVPEINKLVTTKAPVPVFCIKKVLFTEVPVFLVPKSVLFRALIAVLFSGILTEFP
jgi:hypothetical protein